MQVLAHHVVNRVLARVGDELHRVGDTELLGGAVAVPAVENLVFVGVDTRVCQPMLCDVRFEGGRGTVGHVAEEPTQFVSLLHVRFFLSHDTDLCHLRGICSISSPASSRCAAEGGLPCASQAFCV